MHQEEQPGLSIQASLWPQSVCILAADILRKQLAVSCWTDPGTEPFRLPVKESSESRSDGTLRDH